MEKFILWMFGLVTGYVLGVMKPLKPVTAKAATAFMIFYIFFTIFSGVTLAWLHLEKTKAAYIAAQQVRP